MFRRFFVCLLPAALISCAAVDLSRALPSDAKAQPSQLDIDLKQINGTATIGDMTITFEQGKVSVLGGNVAAERPPDAPTPPTPATMIVSKPSWSVYGNPKYNSAFTTNDEYLFWDAGWQEAADRILQMGGDHCYLKIPWSAFEPSVGVYQGESLITRFVDDCPDKPIMMQLSAVDTDSVRHVPSELAAVAWDHASMTAAYKNFLTHMAPYFKGRLYLLGVGNEIDLYFDANPSEIAAYGTFISTVRTHARTLFGSNPFMVTVSWQHAVGERLGTTYVPVRTAVDAVSYTYYPILAVGDGCLTGCDNSLLNSLLLDTSYTAGKPYFYQEYGASRDVTFGGSDEYQNGIIQFTVSVLSSIAGAGFPMRGVTWFTLSDWDQDLLGFPPPFDKFFSETGLRDLTNTPTSGYVTLCNFMGGTNCDPPPLPVCTFTMSPTSAAYSAGAVGTTNLVITTQTGCAWTVNAVGGVPAYITPSALSGTGTTTITYTVTANTSTEGRSLNLLIGDATWSLTQEGATLPPPPPPPCPFTLSATSATKTASAGNGTVDLTTDTGCNWQAQELDGGYDWISIAATSGTASATLTYAVLENTGTANRTARFAIGNATTIFIVTQLGAEAPPPPPDPVVSPCLSTTNSPTGRNPKVSWTPCRQDTYNRMYACYLANPANPPSGLQGSLDCGDGLGGRYMKLIIDNANCTPGCRDQDIGWSNVYAYQMTGDASFLSDAKFWNLKLKPYLDMLDATGYWTAAQLAPFCPGGVGSTIFCQTDIHRLYDNGNTIREVGVGLPRMLDWAWPVLTDAQKARIRFTHNTQIDGSLRNPPVPGMGLMDSDQTVGTYFGTVLMHLAFPEDTAAAANYALAQIGGLTPTASIDSFFFSSSANAQSAVGSGGTARNTIKAYAAMATGGTWLESTEYNHGTLQLLMEGADAVKTITGIDYFPEVTALLPGIAEGLIYEVTPDLTTMHQWGDAQHPHGDDGLYTFPYKFHYATIAQMAAGMLRGTVSGRHLQKHFKALVARYGAIGFGSMEPSNNVKTSGFVFYDPYDPPLDYETTKFYSARGGGGVLTSRSGSTTGDSAFFAHLHQPFRIAETLGRPQNVHHEGWWLGDWQLYRGLTRKWGVTHPLFYGGIPNYRGDGTNSPSMHGHGGMTAFYGNDWVVQNDNYTYATTTTGGAIHASPSCFPACPAVMVNEWSRELTYLPTPTVGGIDTVIIYDRMNVMSPIPNISFYGNGGVRPSEAFCNGQYGPMGICTLTKFTSTNPTFFTLHTDKVPTKVGNTFSWTTSGSENAKLTALFPASLGYEIVDEVTSTDPRFTEMGAERKAHVKIWNSSYSQFDAWLQVVQIGGNGTLTALEDVGKVRGVHLTRAGQSDFVTFFNAQNGGALAPTLGYSSTHVPALRNIRFRGQSFTVSFTAVASTSLVVANDLHPGSSWTLNIDGAGANGILPDAGGQYSFTVSGTGAHTLAFVGNGAPPPPDPSTCPTITLAPTSLTDGAQGSAYSQNIVASGGTGPYTYLVATGTLPAGMTLSTAGVLSGTPTSPGTFTFSVRATDANSCFASAAYTLVIAEPVVAGVFRTGVSKFFANASGSVNTLSATVTVGSGSSLIGLVQVVMGANDTLTSCTLAGNALTLINKFKVTADRWFYNFYIVGPTAGDRTLACSSSVNTEIAIGYMTYKGVHQTTPIDVFTSGSGTGTVASLSVTTTKANTVTVMNTRNIIPPTAGVGSTLVYNSNGYVGVSSFDFPQGSAGLKSMQATYASSTTWGASLFALVPAE